MGSILDLVKRDAKIIVNKGGFEVAITLITPDRSKSVSITGLGTKHWINFDSDGNPINSKNVHITLDEDVLTLNGLKVRNAKGEIYLKGYLVIFKDSSGFDKKYIVRENYPDETLGLIVCILGDFID